MKRIYKIGIALLLVLALSVGGFVLYASGSYAPGAEAMAVLEAENITTTRNQIVFQPEKAAAGLIFYPGAKVEFAAYAPLMKALCEKGVLCVIVKMPLNFAVLDISAADGVREQFPEVEKWYLAGHSLGGAMAASYASKHTQDFRGLILLAAYSTADLSETGLDCLSVYGSRDTVLQLDKYEKYSTNLPADSAERILDGGNHAGFADYGLQSGDSPATISAAQQQAETAEAIAALMGISE